MTAATLLSRLDLVKPTGDGRWIARCPAHDDRSPTLSLRETDDGRVLLHCFAGCGAAEVLRAIGATWADVFPTPIAKDTRTRRAPPVPHRDVLLCLRQEAMVVLLCADAALRHELRETDVERLTIAVSRVEAATRLAR